VAGEGGQARLNPSAIQGLLWMAVSGMLFVAMTATVRLAGDELPVAQAAFIRYAIGLALVAPLLLRLRVRLPPPRPAGLYALRGLVHGGAVIFWFYAINRIPLAEVMALSYTTPVFVLIGAALFLGEPLKTERAIALAVASLGVLIVLRPGFDRIETGQLAQLAAAPLFAASALIAKRLTRSEEPAMIVFMLTLCCGLVLAVPALADWRSPSAQALFWLGLTAVFATGAHYAQTRGFHAAPITLTQPMTFLQILWSALAGWWLFGDHPDVWVFVGGGVILAAVAAVSGREARRASG